jgi:hypothetical protein
MFSPVSPGRPISAIPSLSLLFDHNCRFSGRSFSGFHSILRILGINATTVQGIEVWKRRKLHASSSMCGVSFLSVEPRL